MLGCIAIDCIAVSRSCQFEDWRLEKVRNQLLSISCLIGLAIKMVRIIKADKTYKVPQIDFLTFVFGECFLLEERFSILSLCNIQDGRDALAPV